jgi:hypothetical protein
MGGSVGIAGPWLYDTEMEEYLTITELSSHIKMTPGTIRNLVWKNELIENVHYA